MANIPTFKELLDNLIQDIEAEFNFQIPEFLKSFIRGLMMVYAGKFKLLYHAIAMAQREMFVDTAPVQSLNRWGLVKLGRVRFQAVQGQYLADVNGTAGAVVESSTLFKSADRSASPGRLFIVDQDFVLTGTNDKLLIRALDSGPISELTPNNLLIATSPIANVDDTISIDSVVVEPSVAEEPELYRRRTILSYILEPTGGSTADYRLWSADAQGTQQTYPYVAPLVSNTTNLFVEATIGDSTDGKGTPSQTLLDSVEAVINENPLTGRARRPNTAKVNYLPIVPLDVNIQIVNYTNSSTEDDAVILQVLTSEIARIRPFIPGAEAENAQNDVLNTARINNFIINAVPNALYDDINLIVDGNTVSSFRFTGGNIPFLDSVTNV